MKLDDIVLDGMGLLIPPGEEGQITSRRQEHELARCQGLVIHPDSAPHFHIDDLYIDRHSIFVGWAPDGVPASRNIDFEMRNSRLVQFWAEVVIRVRNTSDQARAFYATIPVEDAR